MDDGLLKVILKDYQLVKVKFEEKFKTSNDRYAYRISSEQGDYVVKLTHSKRGELQLKKDIQILSYLEQYHFPTPHLITAKNGFLYSPMGNRFFYIYRFIHGSQPQPNSDFFKLLGTLLARLHSLPTKKYSHRSNYTPAEQLPSIYRLLKDVKNSQNSKSVEKLLDFIQKFPSFADLPSSFIHSDPYFSNFLQNQNELFLLDWDDAGVAFPIIDIGYVLAHLCLFSPDKANGLNDRESALPVWKANWAKAFINSYQKIRSLSVREKQVLPFAALFTFLTYIAPWKSSKINPNHYKRFLVFTKIILQANLF